MTFRVVLLPGMGATAAMHADLGWLLPSIERPDWPDHRGCRSFAELAERCIEKLSLRPGDRVGGSSMGGMVAAEIAHRLGSPLILIGSCHHPSAIPLRSLAPLVGGMVHDRWLSLVASTSSGSVLSAMAAEVGAGFIRWSLAALRSWPGIPREGLGRIHAIHGLLDPVIPVTRVTAGQIIPGGRHVIAMSHPRIVAGFLAQAVR